MNTEPTHTQCELLKSIHRANGVIDFSDPKDVGIEPYWELVRSGYLKSLMSLSGGRSFVVTEKAEKYLISILPKEKKRNLEFKITGNGGNKVKIFVTGARGNWRAAFKIGVQTFYVCDRSTKAEALWFCKCLRAAFKNLKS